MLQINKQMLFDSQSRIWAINHCDTADLIFIPLFQMIHLQTQSVPTVKINSIKATWNSTKAPTPVLKRSLTPFWGILGSPCFVPGSEKQRVRLILLLWRLMLVFKMPLKSRQDLRANLALDDKDAHLLGADSIALLANTVKSSHLYM